MTLVLVIEEIAGQHSDLQPPSGRGVPYCRCGGLALVGSDSCWRCGRHIRGVFRAELIDRREDAWRALMRERPHGTGRRMLAA